MMAGQSVLLLLIVSTVGLRDVDDTDEPPEDTLQPSVFTAFQVSSDKDDASMRMQPCPWLKRFKAKVVMPMVKAFKAELQKGGSLSQVEETTPVDFQVDERYPHQPQALFTGATTLEDAVTTLRTHCEPIQAKLVQAMNSAGQAITGATGFKVYDPNVKSVESALRKAKATYCGPNRIRQLTDVFRGSIVVESMADINKMVAEDGPSEALAAALSAEGFDIVRFKNMFVRPWSDGYRDLNMRVMDRDTQLVGELQIHLCAVKKFTEIVGHKFYEVLRGLGSDEKSAMEPYFNQVSKDGYDNSITWPEKSCLAELSDV